MAFGQMDITAVTRVQDFTSIKQNEDNRSVLQQTQLGHNAEKEIQVKATQVRESEDIEWHSKQFDARQKGDNQYTGDGGKNRKKKQVEERVVVKGKSGFDLKI